MKDQGRVVEGEDLVEEIVIGDVAEVEGRLGGELGEMLLEVVKAALRGFEEKAARSSGSKTQCERGADGTAGAGDEDGVLDEGRDGLRRCGRQWRAGKKRVPVKGCEGGNHR